MDNASIHKSKVFKDYFMNSHSVMYNAPYSPQLNPIELAFSIIKRDIKAKNPKSLGEHQNRKVKYTLTWLFWPPRPPHTLIFDFMRN